MKNSKKLLSLVLAIVMVFSALSLVASAFTRQPSEIADNCNVKYEVEKVSEASMADDSSTYTGDNIYAVSFYAKCNEGITTITFPVHFNQNHFAPLMIIDGEDIYYGTESYYDEMEEGNCNVYSLDGDYMKNTGMYKANGDSASKALAKCIGLGSPNSGGIDVVAEYVAGSNPKTETWRKGLSDDLGVMFINLDVTCKSKTAYLNNTAGITVDTGWCKMGTVYFVTLPGVTDADCIGDQFGVLVDDCFGPDLVTDGNGLGYYDGNFIVKAPELNYTQNAVIKADAEKSIITPISSQIRFRGIGANGVGTYDNEFDVRTRATIAEADFNAAFGDDVAALDKIADIGFVYASTTDVPDFDMETAIKVAKGEDVDGIADAAKYTKKSCKYIQHADGQYMLTCVITGIKDTTANKEDGVNCIAYVRDIDGNFYCYDAASPASYGQLYEAHRSNFPA